MKIEIGESLLLSWPRHIKECQLVQTNWKPSSKWELKHKEVLERLISNIIKEEVHELSDEASFFLINFDWRVQYEYILY
jgi:hypothetical protein